MISHIAYLAFKLFKYPVAPELAAGLIKPIELLPLNSSLGNRQIFSFRSLMSFIWTRKIHLQLKKKVGFQKVNGAAVLSLRES